MLIGMLISVPFVRPPIRPCHSSLNTVSRLDYGEVCPRTPPQLIRPYPYITSYVCSSLALLPELPPGLERPQTLGMCYIYSQFQLSLFD
jgi:hypothetical protein